MSESYYPEWKGWIWRFVRTAVSGGASTVVAMTVVLQPDLSNIKVYTTALASAFIAGAISSSALALRDMKGSPNKDSAIDKIPL